MFGFLRTRQSMLSGSDNDQLSRYHCGLCHALRHDYFSMAGLLAGMEGRFLVLLIDAQTNQPANQCMKRCPANAWLHKFIMTDYSMATRFSAAATVFLFEQKLIDNIMDDRSVFAKIGLQIFRKHFGKARLILSEMTFPLDELSILQKRQHDLENSKNDASLEVVCEPFGTAMGTLLAHTAILADKPQNKVILGEIGHCLGRAITLIDACQDYVRDKKRKRYNAIRKALNRDLKINDFSWALFDRIENYLLVNLQSIRLKTQALSLKRHHQIIQNILMLGLYDEAAKALNTLSNSVSSPSMLLITEQKCSSCGFSVKSSFCPKCGMNRLFGNFQTTPPITLGSP
jgi:predicted Zn-ribbon and HTH transcriptional regulator